MGQKGAQDASQGIHGPSDHLRGHDDAQSDHGLPPPLPPRVDLIAYRPSSDGLPTLPPSYSEAVTSDYSQLVSPRPSEQNLRSTSTQSLVPHQSVDQTGKRTLLAIFVHGFMGNETSFQRFPTDVHKTITANLAQSHVVHTKIYPRYKSRKHIEHARDAFSEWLRPHKGPNVDVILLGHSMGGILCAEVALLQLHQILGTINFDTPFLGMHPGVIASGLGSLFKPAPDTPNVRADETQPENVEMKYPGADDPAHRTSSSSYFPPHKNSASMSISDQSISQDTLSRFPSAAQSSPTRDPNYDPPFVNDVRLPQRSGWANALHFINKHSDGLTKATQSYVMSHLEFGGAMADYKGLKKRYERLRALEDADSETRTRFINYYTASTGRSKKLKPLPVGADEKSLAKDDPSKTSTVDDDTQTECHEADINQRSSMSPRISIDSATDEVDRQSTGDTSSRPSTEVLQPVPSENDASIHPNNTFHSNLESDSLNANTTPPTRSMPSLPPLPCTPEKPAEFDPNLYSDKETRKLAEKEHACLLNAYKQSVKDRDKAINSRRKFLEKREKESAKRSEKLDKLAEKQRKELETRGMEHGELERYKIEKAEAKKTQKGRRKAEREEARKVAKASKATEEKPQRDRKFCMLPNRYYGKDDDCWVRVFMPGMDEVGAHCGLFVDDGERYRDFVRDVAERIEMWVEESRS